MNVVLPNNMYILLTLFFISLAGIIIMIGRKLLIIQNGQTLSKENFLLKTSYLKEVKHLTVKNIKGYGYKGLVVIIRSYIRTVKVLKNKYQEIKEKTKKISKKNIVAQKKEVNKFLGIISEYKQKIREIKHRIKEEEENL